MIIVALCEGVNCPFACPASKAQALVICILDLEVHGPEILRSAPHLPWNSLLSRRGRLECSLRNLTIQTGGAVYNTGKNCVVSKNLHTSFSSFQGPLLHYGMNSSLLHSHCISHGAFFFCLEEQLLQFTYFHLSLAVPWILLLQLLGLLLSE